MSTRVRARVSNAASALLIAALVIAWSSIAKGQQGGYFTPADSMSSPRGAAAAVQLDNGDILFAGESASSGASELYQVASDRFTAVGHLYETRVDAAAVRLRDGRVLIVGGSTDVAPLASAELYDPLTRAFTPTGGMNVARVRPAVALLPDGRALIAGGYDGSHTPLNTAELFDPVSGTFILADTMFTGRAAMAAVLHSGAVLLVGGEFGGDAVSAELYDPVDGTFHLTGSLNIPRQRYAVTALADGRVLVTGGVRNGGQPVGTAEVYDPAVGQFRIAGESHTPRYDHSAVALADGSVLIVGGQDAAGAVVVTETFDPDAGIFTPDAALIEGRVAPVLAPVSGGVIVAGGGRASSGRIATAERYSREDNRAETTIRLSSSTATSTYGQPVTYTVTVQSSGGKVATGVVEFLDGPTLLGIADLDGAGRSSLTIATTPAGIRPIYAIYRGSSTHRRSEAPPIQQTVTKAPASGALFISSIQRQYSDPLTFTATISPANAAQSVTFTAGAAVIGTAPVIQGRAVLSTTVGANIALGSRLITAVFNQDVANYAIANTSKSMSIVKEDARVTQYGGTTYTACPTCTTAKVVLRASVRDISATMDANGDVSPGDIRNATFTFINRSTYAALATVPVTVADGATPSAGNAVYVWTVDLGSAASKTFRIGYSVSGLYTRSSYDYVYVTVAKPKS